jgi:hypothetical protein
MCNRYTPLGIESNYLIYHLGFFQLGVGKDYLPAELLQFGTGIGKIGVR